MKPRIRFIEGLRGVMAVSVIVHHFIYFYFPDMVIHGMSRAGDLFAATPLNFFVNGKVAVHYFFLISGFLILYNIEDRIGFSAYLKRVFFRILKILCMVVPAVLFSSFLLRLGFANTLIQSYPYGIIHGLLLPQPSFSSVFTDVINVFTNGYSSYIPPYWTIHYEIFAFLALLPVCSWFRSKRFFFPLMVAAYAVYVYFDPYYATVILGVITCYLYQNGKLKQIFHSKMKLLILAIGLYCICIPNVKTGIYSIFNARGLSVLAVDTIRGIGTCIAFSSCLLSPKIQKLFEKPILLEAGRISFALYSLHYPVLLYITTALACFFWQKLQIPNSAAVVCSAVLTMPLIWYLSKFAQRYLVETGTSLFHKRAR